MSWVCVKNCGTMVRSRGPFDGYEQRCVLIVILKGKRKEKRAKKTYQFLWVNHTKLNVLNWLKLSHYAIGCGVCGCKMARAKLENPLRMLWETRSGGESEGAKKFLHNRRSKNL